MSTTIDNIIDDVDVRLPNVFTEAQKIGWINDEIRKIKRELMTEDTDSSLTTVADQVEYTLPTNIKIENIIEPIYIAQDAVITSTTVFKPYYFAKSNKVLAYGNYDLGDDVYFDFLDGKIGFYPTPTTTGLQIFINFYKTPATYTATTDVIELEDDWLDILKFSLMRTIAMSGNNPDIELANMYGVEYNNLMSSILHDKHERKPYYPVTKDVMKKRSRMTGRTPQEIIMRNQ